MLIKDSFEDYAATNAVNCSGLKRFSEEPARYLEPSADTEALSFGRLFHEVVAEGRSIKDLGFDEIVSIRGDVGLIEDMVAGVSRNRYAAALIERASGVEVSAYWDHPEYGIPCKGRYDLIVPGIDAIVDIKTCRDASPKEFYWACRRYRYHWQAAWYMDGSGHGNPDFICQDIIFLACEKSLPHRCIVHQASPEMIEAGRREIAEILPKFVECWNTNTWPRHEDHINTINWR